MQSLPQADNPKRLPYGPNDAAQDGYDLVTEEWRPTDNEELKRTIERLERKEGRRTGSLIGHVQWQPE
jgi:hypothetical protein